MKLGKLPARKNSVSLRLRDYLKVSSLPKPPKNSSHMILMDHHMFGNDQYGDCVCAGAGHETLLWNNEAGRNIDLTTDNILQMYSDLTGFDPSNPSTDQGTDMALAAKWRRDTGLRDNTGQTHKVAAYLALTPGNIEEVKQVIYLFDAVGIGWELPESAQKQFARGKPWVIINGSPIEGGHYTAAIGYDPTFLYIITWGKIVRVSWRFFVKYNDEGIIYFSEEFLKSDKSPEGFDKQQLVYDLSQL